MENMRITQLKIMRSAFITAANLVNYMNNYKYYMDEKDRKTLDVFTQISDGLPLPSGRWGNAIALALEVNNYIAAEYLIDNSDRLGLDTNTVVSELGGKNPWNLKDEYLFSQLTYEEDILPIRNGQTEENYKAYVNSITRNKLANKRLEEKLSIASKDKKILSR